jgi:UDPglucose 6-dehydrogenase
MKVAVVGTGHVGLVTSVALATLGHRVVGIDADPERMASLQRGRVPFHEPNLQERCSQEVAEGRLSFTGDAAEAISDAAVVFICVGTPPRADGNANLLAIERSAAEVARHGADGVVVVEKSTVPMGTAERIRLTIERGNPRLRFDVVSNPEFLREGAALRDSLRPDRILVGAESEHGFRVMERLYEPLVVAGHPLLRTDIRTAELAKHASNAFLALKISFANALARLCERAGADVTAVADVMGADPRIGRDFLDAGLGYGGYCFPKDVVALERLASGLGYDFPLLKEVARLNDEAMRAVMDKVQEALWNLEDKRIALLGLAFKPGTDDVRFSPSLALAGRLLASGARVVGYDPRAGANAKDELPDLEVVNDAYAAASGAHCLVVATDWEEFRALDLDTLRSVMAYPVLVDGRNLLDPSAVAAAGFSYYPTGRPPSFPRAPSLDPGPSRARPPGASSWSSALPTR